MASKFFNLRLPPELHDDVKRLSQETGLTMNEIIRRSVDAYVHRHEPDQFIPGLIRQLVQALDEWEKGND